MNTELRIRELLKNKMGFGERVDKISLETPLDVLKINSVDFIKFVVLLENEFDLIFEDNQLSHKKFNTFGDMVAYVTKQLEENNN